GDTAMVINNNISDNYSDHHGGGIGIDGSNVLLCSNYISGNDGGSGGGVFIGGAITTITGNLIVGNTAVYGGGVGEYSGGNINLENNTIAFNSATARGGGLQSKNDSISITNSIIWGNNAPIGSQIYLLAFADSTHAFIEYSNVEYGQDSIFQDTYATLYWGPGNIDIDPQFEVGPLGDYHLSYGSPCIDAGNPDWEYNDPEDPFNPGYALWPAMGTTRNDMGAFGGGGVNYWLTVEEEESSPPEAGLVLKSFPNPFSSSCTVCYQLEYPSHVVLSVFDLSGRLVETLIDEVVPAGMYSEYLDGSGLCSGMYLIRLVAGEHVATRRCIVVR
ncbi:MAG: T9SS type A sorting domain-containing protein, partial [Candidatus Aegiribacteria sp.]|nr:T9SS type A sorting domain-containing protein [Candidatus Aegiribacteria sp.]